MLQCICSVVDHSWRQSVVQTKKWQSEPCGLWRHNLCELRLVRCNFHCVIGILGILPYKLLEIFSASTVLLHGSIMLPPHQPRVFARLARWQMVHNILDTNKILYKTKKKQQPDCCYCHGTDQMPLHLFVECSIAKLFCNKFTNWYNTISYVQETLLWRKTKFCMVS